MFKATIKIVLRPSILDVQGKAVLHAVHDLGYAGADQIRIGKHVEVILNVADKAEAHRQTDEICRKLLANTVMEDYTFTLEQI